MKYTILVTLFLGLLSTIDVQAKEVNPQIANCSEFNSPAMAHVLEACAEHIGCRLELNSKKSCPAASVFIGKIKSRLTGNTRITNEVVFEAALPAITHSKAMEKKIAEFRKVMQANKDAFKTGQMSYRDNTGEITYYYEGGLVNGKRQGIGIMVGKSGSLRYGQFVNDAHEGQGWFYTDSSMFVGNFVDNAPSGSLAFMDNNGTVLVGFHTNIWKGVLDIVTRRGGHYKELYDNHGNEIGKAYSASTPDSVLLKLVDDRENRPIHVARGTSGVAACEPELQALMQAQQTAYSHGARKSPPQRAILEGSFRVNRGYDVGGSLYNRTKRVLQKMPEEMRKWQTLRAKAVAEHNDKWVANLDKVILQKRIESADYQFRLCAIQEGTRARSGK